MKKNISLILLTFLEIRRRCFKCRTINSSRTGGGSVRCNGLEGGGGDDHSVGQNDETIEQKQNMPTPQNNNYLVIPVTGRDSESEVQVTSL